MSCRSSRASESAESRLTSYEVLPRRAAAIDEDQLGKPMPSGLSVRRAIMLTARLSWRALHHASQIAQRLAQRHDAVAHGASDDELLDFAGTFYDLQLLRVAVVAFHRVIGHVTGRA